MKKYLLIITSFLISISVYSQNINNQLNGLDAKIESFIEQYNAMGLSIAIVKNDSVIYSKGFGYRDASKKLPVTTNTAFHIASMSKAFTGSLLGILESKGQLSLKDKPALHVPNFHFFNEKMDNLITIEDLLSHKSGIGTQGISLVVFPEKDKLKTVQRLRYLKPESEVKNSWNYSNMGYTLAGVVAEQVTDKSWEDNIKERIFEPLQMNNSYTTIESMKKSKDFALGYNMYQGEVINVPFENYYSYSPAGSIKSSINDLSHWMRAWLNKGDFNGQQILPQDYVTKATKIQNTKYDEVYEEGSFLHGEGFGWRLRSYYGSFRVRHGGNTNGFTSLMDMFPLENIGIVVLCNQGNSLLPYAISDYISRQLLELHLEEHPVVVNDMYQAEADQPFNKDKTPTHDLSNYIGSYDADGFGTFKITEENGRLLASSPAYTFKLQHLNYNNFYLKGMKDFQEAFDPEFTLQFLIDTKGKIYALELYAQKEPVVFLRQ